MGGYGSGRSTGRQTADASLRIDIAWMLRIGLAKDGCHKWGSLHWTCRGEPSGAISYTAHMDEPGEERLELSYTRGEGEKREHVKQTIRLCYTVPNYGGKRWWMICPFRGIRVGKLYKPGGGDRFASRKAWRLAYHIQHVAPSDRPLERLFALQKKLGSEQGVGAFVRKPKGMWQRTYERHRERLWELEDQCNMQMMAMLASLNGRLNR